jgi:hypothetical protein
MIISYFISFNIIANINMLVEVEVNDNFELQLYEPFIQSLNIFSFVVAGDFKLNVWNSKK